MLFYRWNIFRRLESIRIDFYVWCNQTFGINRDSYTAQVVGGPMNFFPYLGKENIAIRPKFGFQVSNFEIRESEKLVFATENGDFSPPAGHV